MDEELHLLLLGGMQITRGSEPVTGFVSGKVQALLCYLAVTGRPHLRPALAGLLWADMPEADAKANLRQALANLRRLLSPHLSITRQAIAFNRDSPHWLDVERFETQAGGASAEADIERLREAVELYRGDFLEGFYVRQAPAFEEWALAQRARLHELAMQALHLLAAHYGQQGRAGQAASIDYTTRLLALEPWREDAHRQLMLLLARSGQRGGALAQYETCCRVLAEELGVEPGAETAVLAEAIKTGQIESEPGDMGLAAGEVRPNLKAAPKRRFTTSLVGRAAEMEALHQVWDLVVAGSGQVVLVEGEPGVGKTRLIEELLREVADGAVILRAKCPELENPLAYTLFVDPLREALSWGRPASLTDTWLAEVARLLPELHDRYPNLPQPPQLDPADERRRLFDAVCTALLCLAEGQPLLLFLDDMQWADATSLELLNHLCGWTGQAPVLIIGAYRPYEVGVEHPLQTTQRAWRRAGLLTRLPLEPLSETAVGELLQELTIWTGQDPSFGKLVYRETAGNPLFVVETVASLQDEGRLPESAEDWSRDFLAETLVIPSQVQTVIENRLHRLDDLSRGLIAAASVLRSRFEAEMVQAVSGHSELETLESLERLLGVGLLIQAGEDRFDFSHDKIREVAYRSLSRLRRKLLHRRMAETLELRHRGREKAVAERLAYHYEGSGLSDKALEYHLQAGHVAREMYAHQAAVGHYQKALAYLKEEKDYGRAARTLMQLGLTYHNVFDFRRTRRAYQEGFGLWQRAGETQSIAPPPAPHALRMDWREPATVDPTIAFEVPSIGVIDHLFSGLVDLSLDLDVVPDVARAWGILEGGRKYVFHLRDDVRWSDGVPVTASDFEYAWKRALDPATGSPYARVLYDVKGARAFQRGDGRGGDVGVRALDEHTLAVELEKPTGYFLHLLTTNHTYPVPRHVVDAQGEDWTEAGYIVTNGPFRLEAWDRGESMRLSRNSGYHGRFGGNLERVELIFRRGGTSADSEVLERYEAGDLDVLDVGNLPLPVRDRARQRHAEDYITGPYLFTGYAGFNVSRSPFDDHKVRRAFVLATDREALANVALGGYEFPATGGFVPPGMPGHSAEIGLPYEPDRARQLLAEAGYPGGRGIPTVELLAPQIMISVCEPLQAQWRENLGIEVSYETMEWAPLRHRLTGAPPHMYVANWIADYPDPEIFLRANLFRRSTRWRNDAYEGLLEEARRVMDQEKRMKLYQQADRILVEEAPIIPLTHMRMHLLVKPWVSRYPTSAIRYWFWKDVIIEPH
jgi:ABC-type oligopeptide transport system substrate-binding subunit/DNA-binding SARP family transcriptional activator